MTGARSVDKDNKNEFEKIEIGIGCGLLTIIIKNIKDL